MSEQRISDEQLDRFITEVDALLAVHGSTIKNVSMLIVDLARILRDLRAARAALRLREQGGAFDEKKCAEVAALRFADDASRYTFFFGAKWQAEQSQQPAPAPSPDAAPTYRERLRDEFALAFAASGDGVDAVYRFADEAMREREKAGAQ